MRQRRAAVALILGACLLAAGVGSAGLPSSLGYREGQPLAVERAIAPGIVHRFESRTEGPYTINVTEVDLGRPDLVMEAEKGLDALNSQETVPAMVKRLADPNARPLVAINADFWGKGAVPINMFVDEGIIWRMPFSNAEGKRRAIFAFNKTERFIGTPDFRFNIRSYQSDPSTLEIAVIGNLNGPAEGSGITAYNSAFGREAPLVPDSMNQVVIQTYEKGPLPNASVVGTVLSTDMRTSVTLDPNIVVLHINGEVPGWLQAGADVVLEAQLGGLKGPVEGVVGGGPMLVRGGEVVAAESTELEGFGKSGISDRHPRTALGLKADGKTLVLVVVDGRQPRRSAGMTFPELGELMKSLGCVEAMNLDGGGSSTMVVGGELANFPSDSGGARPVSNALVIRRTAPLGAPEKIAIAPAEPVVPVGARINVRVTAADRDGERVPIDNWKVFTPESPRPHPPEAVSVRMHAAGESQMVLRVEDATGATRLVMTNATGASATALKPSTDALLLASGDEVELRFDFVVPEGVRLSPGVQPDKVELPSFLEWVEPGVRLRAAGRGAGRIRASAGALATTIPVAVDQFASTVFVSCDDKSPVDFAHTRTESPSPAPTVVAAGREGTGAWQIEYVMKPGGTSKLALPLKAAIPGEPLAVGLWLKGDGNEHWFRGILSDADGDRYYLDFTSSQAGIDWKDEWRFLTAGVTSPTVMKAKKATPKAPLTLDELYLVQPQEAAKKNGTLVIDGISALNLPAIPE